MQDRPLPDRLSDWEVPPVSDAEPVRVFESAEQALAFLAAIVPMRQDAPAAAGKRVGRRLRPAAQLAEISFRACTGSAGALERHPRARWKIKQQLSALVDNYADRRHR